MTMVAQRPMGEDAAAARGLDGRDARLDTAREWLSCGGSVLFFGAAGAGKSCAVAAVAAQQQGRQLRCTAAPGDARRPYSSLGRLLASVTAAELEPMAAARRGVLVAVLAEQAQRLCPTVVAVAVASLISELAGTAAVLLIVDDAQWMDQASVEVLECVAGQLDDLPVRMVAAERVPGDSLPTRRNLCLSPLLVIHLAAPEPATSGPHTGSG
jgi:hypothetical protein